MVCKCKLCLEIEIHTFYFNIAMNGYVTSTLEQPVGMPFLLLQMEFYLSLHSCLKILSHTKCVSLYLAFFFFFLFLKRWTELSLKMKEQGSTSFVSWNTWECTLWCHGVQSDSLWEMSQLFIKENLTVNIVREREKENYSSLRLL